MRKLYLLLCLTALMFGIGHADDLSSKLSNVASSYATGYLQPLSDAFGADINSGFFHSAKMTNGFHLYIGVKAFAATIPSADQLFNLAYNDSIHVDRMVDDPSNPGGPQIHVQHDFSTTLNGIGLPTIFGDDKVPGVLNGTVSFDTTLGGNVYHIPLTYQKTTIGGVGKINYAPLAMPQVTLGTIMGTDFTLRLIPKTNIGDYGSVGFWGIGVRHSISQYLGGENAPVDIAAGFAIQRFTITAHDTTGGVSNDYDLLKASAWLFNVEVSKSFSLLTLYGGLQMEKASMDIQYFYNAEVNGTTVKFNPAFSLDAKNTFRAIVGVNFALGPININADYNMGSTTVISGGFGLAF
ncbi:MAG: DUF6588 family protein [Bacteroidota bacterium]